MSLNAMIRGPCDCEMLVSLFATISACCSWSSEASLDALASGLLVGDDAVQHEACILLGRIERVTECTPWVSAINPFLAIAFARLKQELNILKKEQVL